MAETKRSSQLRGVWRLARPMRPANGHNQSMGPDARATRLISNAKQLPHSTPPNGREGTRELLATPTGRPVTTPCNSAPHREHCALLCALASKWIDRIPDGRVSTFFHRRLASHQFLKRLLDSVFRGFPHCPGPGHILPS